MASIFLYVLIGLLGLGLLSFVSKVGQERKPITGADATAAIILVGLEISALVYVLGQL